MRTVVTFLFFCALSFGSPFVERTRLATRDVAARDDDGWEESEVKFPGEDAAQPMCAAMKDGVVTTAATKCATQCVVIKTGKGITSMCDPSALCSHPGTLAGLAMNALPAIANGKCIEYCKDGSCAEMHCTQSWLGTGSSFPSSCTKVQSNSPAPLSPPSPPSPPAPPSGDSTAQCVMLADSKKVGPLENCAPGVKQCQVTEMNGKVSAMCDNAKLCGDPGRQDGTSGKFKAITDGKCITVPLTLTKIYCARKYSGEKNGKHIPVPCPCDGCPHKTKTTTSSSKNNLNPSDSGSAATAPQMALAAVMLAAAAFAQRQ